MKLSEVLSKSDTTKNARKHVVANSEYLVFTCEGAFYSLLEYMHNSNIVTNQDVIDGIHAIIYKNREEIYEKLYCDFNGLIGLYLHNNDTVDFVLSSIIDELEHRHCHMRSKLITPVDSNVKWNIWNYLTLLSHGPYSIPPSIIMYKIINSLFRDEFNSEDAVYMYKHILYPAQRYFRYKYNAALSAGKGDVYNFQRNLDDEYSNKLILKRTSEPEQRYIDSLLYEPLDIKVYIDLLKEFNL